MSALVQHFSDRALVNMTPFSQRGARICFLQFPPVWHLKCEGIAAEESLLRQVHWACVKTNDESWRLKLIGNNLIILLKEKQRCCIHLCGISIHLIWLKHHSVRSFKQLLPADFFLGILSSREVTLSRDSLTSSFKVMNLSMNTHFRKV